MIQYLELIKPLLGKDPQEDTRLLRTIERLYLVFVRSPFRFLGRSEEGRIAADILSLESLIEGSGSLQRFKPRSRYFRSSAFLRAIRHIPVLAKEQIAQLEREHVGPVRFHITAVFITALIQMEHRKDRFRWLITVVLSIIGTALATIKLIGDLNGNG
jgi:hypothetical protein